MTQDGVTDDKRIKLAENLSLYRASKYEKESIFTTN